eukprot:CAMPEP_0194265538 /NCGR_PEP_ID=MMETSP0169-20130528/744_1 /TAXON_ID=218684 /ORGANISM="Corethron pennatum, Strain L29A3" /LENGTH=631 /DNA_ID=CAMNT_0039006021 /DNA_START=208 /DNA_END=2100 /DNA_ORIENTATION=+
MKIVLSKDMLFLLVAAVYYNGQVDARRERAPPPSQNDDEKELSNVIHCSGLTPDSVGVVDIPDDWTEITFKAFAECEEIKSVEIPAKITKIKEMAFLNSGLRSITFEAGSTLKEIGKECFRQSDLQSILIPSSVTSVGASSFLNTKSLSSVTFEANSLLEGIGVSAFSECGIITMDIPDRVASIQRMAFANNNVLEEVMFGEDSDLRTIENDAFLRCYSLKSINIPSTASISTNPFYLAKCSDLMLPGNIVVDCSVTNTLAPTTSAPITSMPTTLAPTTSAPSSSSPTTFFDGQDFSIISLRTEFYDENNEFFIMLNYMVGVSVKKLNLTLFSENCTNLYDDTAENKVIAAEDSSVLSMKKLSIFKEMFSKSSLVTTEFDSSKGQLSFCVKAEAVTEDNISVTFRKSNIKLSYDLTKNTFRVDDNSINEDAIKETSKEVTATYGVEACRCDGQSNDSFECDTKPSILDQNNLVFICIRPSKSSINATYITTFDMKFVQDSSVKYTAVTLGSNGPEQNPLSQIQKSGQIYRVASRLIPSLFEESSNSFNVKGNAYLSFKSEERRLTTIHISSLRSAQDVTSGGTAGEGQFEMNVKLKKRTVVGIKNTTNYSAAVVFAVGGFALFLLYLSFFA